ncbi:hypothetical protein ACSBR1_034618 [Camellia fascicularis]
MGSKKHILVFPFPAQGHINPLLQFSKRLSSKGLKVTLITTTSVTNSMHIHSGGSNSIQIESIHDGFNSGKLGDNIHSYLNHFITAVSQNLIELADKYRNSSDPPIVLVYDAIMPWCLDVAQRLGIPGAAFFTQMCGVGAIYYHQSEGNLKVRLSMEFDLPSMPMMEIGDLPSLILGCDLYPSFLSLMVNQFSNFRKADWLLFNTFDKLEEEVLNWMAAQWPIKTVGPTVPSMYLDNWLEDDKDYGLNLFKPNVEACMTWLDTKEKASVVYASFGSLATAGQEQMEELPWGLKNSDTNFLWIRAGVRIKVNDKGIITREEIERSIKDVMEGERGNEIRRNTVKWKEFAKEAVDKDGSSDKNIEEFVSKLVAPSKDV